MWTSYLVKCPHVDCKWFGSLLPSSDMDSWKGCVPTVNTALFECPNCGKSWKAEIKGDDVIPFPIEDEVTLA